MMKKIFVRGATENNLKNINTKIPHNQLTVVTGLSGSGKSSLVRDILQREGQRMYLETFSAYSRSRLGKIRPAKASEISGLLPVISVGQTHIQANRRSTAGTFSDISPMLRQLFSRFNDQNKRIARNSFSFNSEKGWCPHCKGLGIEEYIDQKKLVDDERKSLREQALTITLPNGYTIYSQVTIDELEKVCKHHGFTVDQPWNSLSEAQKNVVLNGSKEVKVLYGKHSLESRMKWTGMTAKPREEGFYKGIIPVMEDILRRDRNDNILRFVSSKTCSICSGERINAEARNVLWKGMRYPEIEQMSFQKILTLLQNVNIDSVAEKTLVKEIEDRIAQLCNLSIGHIAPNRLSETLSQGELRRMRLAQLHQSGLTGVLYLFDEPSIGLHMRDVQSLIDTFYQLVKKGNTVVVVEHNENIIKSAQHLIELGPGAGKLGGQIVFSGSNEDYKQQVPYDSLLKETIANVKQELQTKTPINKNPEVFKIDIKGSNNIIDQQFYFARQQLNVITGVSGAGKSTLVNHGLLTTKEFEQIIYIDQKPIGRTSRSNPATYTGLFDELRKLFAKLPEAKAKKLKAGHFSFNNKQGQCSACLGTGVLKTGMHIFEDLVQNCPVCKGSRYQPEIFEIRYKEKNIAEILSMSINEAADFFSNEPAIRVYLDAMLQLGLGYLHLGQSSTTLSGGEAQRIKLATSLHKKVKQQSLYILDEPTTGLHNANIQMLLEALQLFINEGHTVIVVEHDSQVINFTDWIVDIGPEGGDKGGLPLYCGPRKGFYDIEKSPTARALQTKTHIKPYSINTLEVGIKLNGIFTNNLKGFNLNIKAGEFIAFTGVSGSGKTSLLIDTLHNEGQRLFIQNMSSYKRLQISSNATAQIQQTLQIQPTVAVTADVQKPDIRSTIASLSGIYDLLRLLFARFSNNKSGKLVTAADFSLANEYAVCKSCEGSGFEKKCVPENILKDTERSILDGGFIKHKTTDYFISPQNKYRWILLAMADIHQINLELPWEKLDKIAKERILFGTGEQVYKAIWKYERKNNKGDYAFENQWPGFCNLIEADYKLHYPSQRGKNALELLSDITCRSCNGDRLNPEMLEYKFDGHHIGEILKMTVSELLEKIKKPSTPISQALQSQLTSKLSFLINAGLGYLILGKPGVYLSTGELKWVKLSSLLASNLSGMCIILDEPSAGMDDMATTHLIEMLKESQKRGNTILISDHHKRLIEAADRIIEIGPDAGKNGGQILADIKPDEVSNSAAKIAKMIINNDFAKIREKKDLDTQTFNIDGFKFYFNRINLIYGKTGSGKTTLLKKIHAQKSEKHPVIAVKSGSLLSNKNSTIATRTSILNDLKKHFARLPEAVYDNLKPTDFGFNNKKFQCPVCKGVGYIKTSLDFLPDIKEICHECNGTRYKEEIQRYKLQENSIYNWLNLTIDELSEYNIWSPNLLKELSILQQVGIGYISANREISTLSEGEQRRLALSEKLFNIENEPALILFDNAGHGLDPINISKLYGLFDRLVANGHTLIIIDEKRLSELADHTINLNQKVL
jgi:excinuclease ABC subunit A